ncbi:poly-gamma-glutamate capsule biosynthesis protein CapA/YwtB (metallophosphatase superfamily) [Paenibacillus sp. V4I9]|uniref:CapA family protein n=1 Tax=Paenibacillus sp. V4I9 TaxID=3042308 RepID=UPI002784C134|nr:CapA family protein [Paenibacillus sp. V4I9]MDQ0889796.1 poly-gamma-glutamate capsule biosynthesis protein CapA/YwtB (metallophosphatase superfamily) [Paenibacillus sp. V4I9]
MSDQIETFRIALTGDSIIARRISNYTDQPTKELIQLIKGADVAFTNLEVLPNNFKGHPAARSDGAHFAAHSWVLEELQQMGFNLYSCANNHALDYGVEGLLATMKELEDRDITYAGIGRSLTDSRMPVYMDFNGASVAMLACTSTFFEEQSAGEQRPDLQGRPGVNPLRYDTTYEVKKDQLEELQKIAQDLGLEQQRKEFVQLGFASDPKNPAIFPFVDVNLGRVTGSLNASFREAESPAVRTEPNAQDINEIIKWVKEAKARADVVIVSLHAHEQGKTREHPAEFIRTFAHRIIDEGADIIVGHGPHLLRGMEMYNGKPIFYSLGNLIGHNESVYKLPADTYKRFQIDPSLTPSEVFRIRNKGGEKGFPADELYWQTVMPICHFEAGKLSKIEIVPVALTHGQEPYKRGRPYLAKGTKAEEILKKFSDLSMDYGTKVSQEERGWVVL